LASRTQHQVPWFPLAYNIYERLRRKTLMAKHSFRASAPSRIRFVMVEAELGDGEIGQITQAIQNALRTSGGPSPVKRLSTATNGTDVTLQSDSESETDESGLEDQEYESADSHS